MFHFLLIFTAFFAISIANETIEQLDTIKANLNEQKNIFSKELPKAEAASNKNYEELAEKFKQFKEQCNTLDTLMRTKFDTPELLAHLYPAKRFNMERLYKYKKVCADFLELDAHQRFEQASRQHQLAQLQLELNRIEETANVNSRELKSGLIKNSIQLLIAHYDKIGKAVVEIENSLETLLNLSLDKEEKVEASMEKLEKECEALKELILKEFNLPDEVVPRKKFITVVSVSTRCDDVLRAIGNTNFEQQSAEKIQHLNNLLQSIKGMVGSKSDLTKERKLLLDAKKNVDKILKNLIQTYQSIGKANTQVKSTLRECKQLYFHDENKAPIQIKYFVGLTKAGQEFAENLKKCLHDGKPEDRKQALKEEKDEFVKKLTSGIHYNGSKHGGPDVAHYVFARDLEQQNVEKNREGIFHWVEQYSIVPKIEILNAEKKTMENALQLVEVYKQEIGPIEENAPISSN